jgi:hypothetical protein
LQAFNELNSVASDLLQQLFSTSDDSTAVKATPQQVKTWLGSQQQSQRQMMAPPALMTAATATAAVSCT